MGESTSSSTPTGAPASSSVTPESGASLPVGGGASRSTPLGEDENLIEKYKSRLDELQRINTPDGEQRRYSLAVIIMMAVCLGVCLIVIVYLFTSGSKQDSLDVRTICTTADVQSCITGLQQQLKEDSTAALRSLSHYIFTWISWVITVIVFKCLGSRHRLKKNQILQKLPNDEVDLWSSRRKGPPRPNHIRPLNWDVRRSIEHYHLLYPIVKHALPIMVQKRMMNEPDNACADPNWGFVNMGDLRDADGAPGQGPGHGGVATKVNFKRDAADGAFVFISNVAGRVNVEYRIKAWETVRDYVSRLELSCQEREPPLDHQRCEEFVALYDEARFCAATFDAAKWNRVRKSLEYFARYFDEARDTDRERARKFPGIQSRDLRAV